MNAPADWQLPPGVDRGLWDYLHSPDVVQNYDASLAGSSLFTCDIAFVEEFCRVPGRLIDLGCGTGRLLIALARKGFRVLGVDLSLDMLRAARSKAEQEGVAIDLLRANLTCLEGLADGSFDYAACLFSTLGMVRGAEERRRVVAHAARLLRPGGVFVVHVHNRWFNAWNPEGRRWLARDLLKQVLGRESAGDRWMPPHQGVAGLTLHLFTRREIRRLLIAEGFRVCEMRPVGLGQNGRLAWPWWQTWLRSYGYLIAAEKRTERGG